MELPAALSKDPAALIPAIVQDATSGEILMLAYMNARAFQETVKNRQGTYWSRSRNELWVKGATSGHTQTVREILIDCDGDTVLLKVDQVGAACHTGNRSCFTDLDNVDGSAQEQA